MKFKITLLAVLFCTCLSFTSNAQQVVDSKFGKGVFNVIAKDSSWSMKFAPRMQFLSSSSWDVDNGNGNAGEVEHNFLIRRARLKFNGFAFSPKLKYKMELGLSNRDISGGSAFTRNTPRYILDAVVMWNFAENFELWVGQTKLPGNIERVISSGNLQFVDRSLLNSRFNIDRDTGIQLRHTSDLGNNFVMREKIAVSQGEGRNVTQGNEGGLQFTGRVEFLPLGNFTSKGDYSSSDLKREVAPKLMIGLTYDYNDDAVKTRSNLGNYMLLSDGSLFETTISTVFVDAIFKYDGFSFQGEYASRDSDTPVAVEADGTTTGDIVGVGNSLNLQAGYLFPSNWEFSGRFTQLNFEDVVGIDVTNQYTLGVSKFLAGHKLKVQSDLSYTTVGSQGDNWMYRLQLDVHF